MFHIWWLPRTATLRQSEPSSKPTHGGGLSWADHLPRCSNSCARAVDLICTRRTLGEPVPSEKALQDTVRGSLPEERWISRTPMLQTRWGQGAEGLLSKGGIYLYCPMILFPSLSFKSHTLVICTRDYYLHSLPLPPTPQQPYFSHIDPSFIL